MDKFRCGHLQTEENSMARTDQPGKPRCRICRQNYLLHWNRQRRREKGTPVRGSQEYRQQMSQSRTQEQIGYSGAHRRAKIVLAGQPCYSCGDTNSLRIQSALSHDTPEERVLVHEGGRYDGLAFSMTPSDYIPLCVECHVRYDRTLLEIS